jgi:hypothetical protein
MPSEVKAELTNTEKPVRLVYTARYSNYRKFEASSSVTYAAP